MSDDKFADMVKNIVEELALDVSSCKAVAEGGRAMRKGKGDTVVMKCVARFPERGGSLDRRNSGKASKWISGAGDLAVPEVGKAIKAAVASGGKGKAKTVEEKLGRSKGYYNTKSWHAYGRKRGPQICSVCQGSCCAATREMVEALVDSEILPEIKDYEIK